MQNKPKVTEHFKSKPVLILKTKIIHFLQMLKTAFYWGTLEFLFSSKKKDDECRGNEKQGCDYNG